MNKNFFLKTLFSKEANKVLVAEVDGEKVDIVSQNDSISLKLNDYSEFLVTKDGKFICSDCNSVQYLDDAELSGNSLRIECRSCGLTLKLVSKIRYDFKMPPGIKSLTEGSIYLVKDKLGQNTHCKYLEEKFYSLESDCEQEVLPSQVLTELFLTSIECANLRPNVSESKV